jgi:hypothetical protein
MWNLLDHHPLAYQKFYQHAKMSSNKRKKNQNLLARHMRLPCQAAQYAKFHSQFSLRRKQISGEEEDQLRRLSTTRSQMEKQQKLQPKQREPQKSRHSRASLPPNSKDFYLVGEIANYVIVTSSI